MATNISKYRKNLSFGGSLFVIGASSLALSACGIPKSDFNLLLRTDLANLNYVTQTGTDDFSTPTMEPFLSADPIATNSKSSIELAKSLNDFDNASEYAQNIVNNDQVINHTYDANGKVESSSYSNIGDQQRLNIYLADKNGIEGEPLPIDDASSILGIGFDTFNYVWGGAQSMDVHYKTDASDPNNHSYYLYRIKVYLDQQVPGENILGDEANYWYSADEGYRNLEESKRKVKASDYATTARLDMDVLTGAPYLYMWESNVGLNNSAKCIADQNAEPYISNILEVDSCADFFKAPVDEHGQINSGSGYYANDGDNTITLTYSDREDTANTGTNLPLSIVFNEFASIVYWPIPQEFLNYKYGSVFGTNGPLWNAEVLETLDESTYNLKTNKWNQSDSAFIPALTSFGTLATETAANGPFYISDWEQNYQLRFEKSPTYRHEDEVLTNSFTAQLGLDRGAIVADLFENGWLSRTSSMGYDYHSQISEDNERFLGAQPAAGSLSLLSFNTINGDSKLTNDNNDGKFKLTDWGTRYFKGMEMRELATHSRNFRNAVLYAYDQGIYWKMLQYDKYSPVLFQGSDVATASSISAPNAVSEEKSFQEWLNDSQYKFPTADGTGLQDESVAAAALTPKQFQDAFNEAPSDDALLDKRRNVQASNYYWNQWIAEAKSVKDEVAGDPEDFVLNIISNPNTSVDTFTFAFNESFKGTEIGKSGLTFQTKEIVDYFNAGFHRANEGTWDMGTVVWNPDYLDPASFYTIFTPYDQSLLTSETGYWNYVVQLLELKFAGDLGLNGFNNADALFGLDIGNNKNTIGSLGSSSADIINTVLDTFSMELPEGIHPDWDGKISSLTVDDYKNLSAINNSLVTDNELVDPTGFSTLLFGDGFWDLSPTKRFAVMSVFEILLHYGSPGIFGKTEAINYGAENLVGIARPTAGLFNYRYVYPCDKGNSDSKLSGCEDLFPESAG